MQKGQEDLRRWKQQGPYKRKHYFPYFCFWFLLCSTQSYSLPFHFFVPPLETEEAEEEDEDEWGESGQHREKWDAHGEEDRRGEKEDEALMTSFELLQEAPLKCFSVTRASKASLFWLELHRSRFSYLLMEGVLLESVKYQKQTSSSPALFQPSVAWSSPDPASPSLPYSPPHPTNQVG